MHVLISNYTSSKSHLFKISPKLNFKFCIRGSRIIFEETKHNHQFSLLHGFLRILQTCNLLLQTLTMKASLKERRMSIAQTMVVKNL